MLSYTTSMGPSFYAGEAIYNKSTVASSYYLYPHNVKGEKTVKYDLYFDGEYLVVEWELPGINKDKDSINILKTADGVAFEIYPMEPDYRRYIIKGIDRLDSREKLMSEVIIPQEYRKMVKQYNNEQVETEPIVQLRDGFLRVLFLLKDGYKTRELNID